MDVLLVQPRRPTARRLSGHDRAPPQALLYLARSLGLAGYSVDILDLGVYYIDARRFQQYVRATSPAVVGITCVTASVSNALRAASYVKAASPTARVVIGGPHVTFQAPQTLQNHCIDAVVLGEGDVSFPQLVGRFLGPDRSLEGIQGIAYRENGRVVQTPISLVRDVDSLSYPRRDSLNLSRYVASGAVHTSRGCPFKCLFCAATAMGGGKYRIRSTEDVMEEIRYLVEGLGYRHLHFTDDTLTAIPKRMRAICEGLLRRGYGVPWICESRVDVARRDLLELMARAGCYEVFFGFESGSSEILESIRKRITPGQIEDAVRLCLAAGMRPRGCFMIGFPDDTRKTVRESVEMAKRLKRLGAACDILVLTPYPGTEVYERASELGITIHTDDWDEFDVYNPITSNRNLSRAELRTLYFDAKTEIMS